MREAAQYAVHRTLYEIDSMTALNVRPGRVWLVADGDQVRPGCRRLRAHGAPHRWATRVARCRGSELPWWFRLFRVTYPI